MAYPLNPDLGDVFINVDSETCTWNGTVWVCVPGPIGPGTPPVTSTVYELIPVVNGQTIINLASTVSNTTLSTVYLNGVKMVFTVDYTYITTAVIQWLDADFTLETTDVFEIYKI